MSELKLEAGKFYKTRDGRRAYVAAVLENPLGHVGEYHAAGFIGNYHCFWTINGRNYLHSGPSDLIEEWREPREWTVYVCEDDLRYSHYALLDPPSHGKLLARVTVREGEGL
jgi:hypothetical protein